MLPYTLKRMCNLTIAEDTEVAFTHTILSVLDAINKQGEDIKALQEILEQQAKAIAVLTDFAQDITNALQRIQHDGDKSSTTKQST